MKHLIKPLLLPIVFFSSFAFSASPLTEEQITDLEVLIAKTGSKLIYVDRDCGMPIDPDKFSELIKIKAFSEGFHSIEGIDVERVKADAHKRYGELKIANPMGELCQQYSEQIKDVYPFLKKTVKQ